MVINPREGNSDHKWSFFYVLNYVKKKFLRSYFQWVDDILADVIIQTDSTCFKHSEK